MNRSLLNATTLWDLLLQRARLTPAAPMLIDAGDEAMDGRTWNFSEVVVQVERFAAALLRLGIEPGTQVTWQLPSRIETIFVSLALARLGAIQNPVIHLYGKKEVAIILKQNRSAFYLIPIARAGERDYQELATAACRELDSPPQIITVDIHLGDTDTTSTVLPPPSADNIARWIYYTSGTTSDPKGVCHTDASLIASGRALASALAVKPQDIGSIVFPYAHVGGSMYVIVLLCVGMSALVVPKFVAVEAMALFHRYGVTTSGGSTAHYQAFLGEQRKQPDIPVTPQLALLSGGGAPKPPELFFQVKSELHCRIAHSYGMTEAPMIAGASPSHSDEQLAYSDGLPVEGVEIRIVRLDGSPVNAGESGEICVKGATVFQGYTNADLTKVAFDADGYFHTGDLGMLRADGHLAITGRLKDVIIRKGENVSAREIEDLLFSHAKVRAAAVIGLPDQERGERVCAVIELHDPKQTLTFEEMTAYFKEAGMMRQKIPEQLEIVDLLPRNETFNKVLKFKLREQFSNVATSRQESV
ncbi:class I adenylate-forming enzyme family protein [Herminiimonas arsenitoxidans]|uniref:class I adenylate-forming enzyme family protein n=1 Tax=Herminiimonas arsenitoxidans TaxID=1809410 RepID=UPI000970D4EE|nr:AMP-binding protein [Herminiimonas arsenitoxidans]